MSLLNSLLSSIDPTAASQSPAAGARQTQTPNIPKPTRSPAPGANGTSQGPPLKRKAEDPPAGGQIKIQRKNGPAQSDRINGVARPATASEPAKPKPPAISTSVPYRGTAALSASTATKTSTPTTKRPVSSGNTQNAVYKPVSAAPKQTAGTTPPPANTAAPAKKGSYAAMLARAKEVQSVKPPTPPVKHEPTKILTKKERLALREQAKAGAKGKKSGSVGPPAKGPADARGAVAPEKRKPVEAGYQGTARPAKKPIEVGYKGTARPAPSAPGAASKSVGGGAAKPKPKTGQNRYDGYAAWSDLDDADEDEEEEEDYESDASSDMEGGMWDVEQEEQRALKAAKQEDLEALREENELKRAKEARRRKLDALSKTISAKPKKF